MTESENKLCEICHLVERVYKCPRCSIFTCSLVCCKDHKVKNQCSGVRDRVSYVALHEFNEKHLRSDFHFLEDLLQIKSGAKRTFLSCGGSLSEKRTGWKRRKTSDNSVIEKPQQNIQGYSAETQKLVYEAYGRRIKLLLMPQGMSRRNENESFLHQSTSTIFWKIAVTFVISENSTFEEILNAEMSSTQSSNVLSFNMLKVDENAVLRDFIAASLEQTEASSARAQLLHWLLAEDLHCLMRVLPSQAVCPKFCKLSWKDSIRENLSGRTVIEYPTLFVCPSNILDKFQLLISGEQSHVREHENQTRLISEVPISLVFEDADLNQLCRPDVVENDLERDEVLEAIEGNDALDPTVEHLAYEEFMRALVDLQNHDLQSLKEIIEENVLEEQNIL